MMKYTFVHWLPILCLGVLALGCLILAIRQFVTVKYPLLRGEQTKRSLIVAGWLSVSFFFIVALSGIFVWADTDNFRSVVLVSPILCMAPFVFGISALGTYVQYFWYARLSKNRDDLIQRQVDRFESHDQKPPSK